MHIDEAVAGFMAQRRAKRLSKNSLDRYSQALQRWQRWRTAQHRTDDLDAVEIADLRDFVSYLLDEHIPHSDNPVTGTRPKPNSYASPYEHRC